MRKYFLNDGTSQKGPFDLEELRTQNITAETPIWYEGLPAWTTAGKLEELREFFVIPAAPVVAAAVPSTPVEAPKPVATSISSAPAPKSTAPAGKKSTAWLSYALGLVVLGGVGFLIYQDMEKNKTASSSVEVASVTDTTTTTTDVPVTTTSATDATTPDTSTATVTTTEPVVTSADTVTSANTNPTVTTATTATATQKAATKKAEEEKKKKLAAATAKKADEEKKRQQAAALAAAAAKEMETRNNWPKYITFGKLNYDTKGDGVSAFDVPVFNNTDAVLDKVTIRVDYYKKEKKPVKSETIVIYRIPPHAGLNGKAPESKKGDKVNVFITGVSSRALHFCYPQNNGNSADPYFCN